MSAAARAEEFESLRTHLLAVAYRLTGTFADAEDAVQEAWIRWNALGAGRAAIVEPRAWLTTVVSRIGLNALRSAARRRESYAGTWLPEPVVTRADGTDPLAAVVADEDARFVAMVVLEALTPDQRVAFVLHDGFSVPFSAIAELLDTTDASARQLASRARRAVAAQAPPPRDASHEDVVRRLVEAMAAGDLANVVALLHPEVTFTGDANRRAPTAARVIRGPDKVARLILGLARRYGPRFFRSVELAMVNGDVGVYTAGFAAEGEWPQLLPHIQALTVRDGQVCAIWDVANPDKFTGSPLNARQPTAPGSR